jgi:hypothetical protein
MITPNPTPQQNRMSKLDVNTDRMDQFIDTIVAQVRENLNERKEDIVKAWQATIAEAVDNEDKFPKLKLSFATVVDLECNKIDTTLGFTTAFKSTISTPLPDPDQPEFDVVTDAVREFHDTLKADGAAVTVEIFKHGGKGRRK